MSDEISLPPGYDPRVGLSLKAYARFRKARGLSGGTDTAVAKAIRTGRIARLPNGNVDAVAADRAWADNTDPTQIRHARVTAGEPSEPEPPPRRADGRPRLEVVDGGRAGEGRDPMRPDVKEWEEPQGHGGRLKRTKAEETPFAMKMREQQLRKLQLANDRADSILVERSPVERHVFEAVRRTRDAFVDAPERMAPSLAARLAVTDHAMLLALKDFVSDVLRDLAPPKAPA